ncbi:MAG: tetratricopeptide repeat protein [Vicinamibacterales bacterium]
MKRVLALILVLGAVAISGALAYRAAARDRSYRVLVASGEAAMAAGDTLAAVEDFSGAIALRPDAMLAHLRRGETYRLRGDFDMAARDFRAAAQLDPTATRPLETLGDVLYEQERFKRAAETYQERLKLDDRSAGIRYKLALAHYRDGATSEALNDARSARALDDQLADAYYLEALCLRDLGQVDAAVAALQAAVQRGPGLVPAREELADLFAVTGRYADQIEQLQVIAGLDSRQPQRQVAIGLAQAEAGKLDLAVATLTAAAEQAGDQSAVNTALGRVWLQIAETRRDRTEALGKALEALERAASALNATSETKALYGRALALSGQADAAEQVFQQAIERFPVDATAYLELADVAEQLGHAPVARTALTSYVALTRSAQDAGGLAARIGRLAVKAGDAAGAISWFQKALDERPDDVAVMTMLAEAQMATGTLSEARATVTRAQSLEPANAQIAVLDRRLRKAGA